MQRIIIRFTNITKLRHITEPDRDIKIFIITATVKDDKRHINKREMHMFITNERQHNNKFLRPYNWYIQPEPSQT